MKRIPRADTQQCRRIHCQVGSCGSNYIPDTWRAVHAGLSNSTVMSGWRRCGHGRLQVAQVSEPSVEPLYHAICHRITQGRAFLYTACHIYAMSPNEMSIGKQSRIYASRERGQRPTLQKLETTRHTLTNKSPGTTAEDRTAPYYRTAQTEG
jgi:hypothetical protein